MKKLFKAIAVKLSLFETKKDNDPVFVNKDCFKTKPNKKDNHDEDLSFPEHDHKVTVKDTKKWV